MVLNIQCVTYFVTSSVSVLEAAIWVKRVYMNLHLIKKIWISEKFLPEFKSEIWFRSGINILLRQLMQEGVITSCLTHMIIEEFKLSCIEYLYQVTERIILSDILI